MKTDFFGKVCGKRASECGGSANTRSDARFPPGFVDNVHLHGTNGADESFWGAVKRRFAPFQNALASDTRRGRFSWRARAGWLSWLVMVLMTFALRGNMTGAAPSPGGAAGRDRLLQQALEAYAAAMETSDRDQRLQGFAMAEQLFRQVVTGSAQHEGVRNAALYVNLGNAALQAERLGPAILAYRRALLLNPAHAQARQNLQHARSLLPEWIQRDAASGLADTLFFWRALYARAQILAVAAICFLVATMLLAASLVRRQTLLRHLAIVPLLAWLVLIGSVGAGGNDRLSDEAVVIGQELVVHSADSENSPRRISLPLPSGAEVKITRQRDRWTEIEVSGGRSGWVITSGLAHVI